MKITLNKLIELKACKEGLEYFKSKNFKDDEVELDELIKILKDDKSDYLEWVYKKFKLTGEYISYFKNGNIDYKCFYKEGKEEGECISYFGNGNIYFKCFYKEGVLVDENN